MTYKEIQRQLNKLRAAEELSLFVEADDIHKKSILALLDAVICLYEDKDEDWLDAAG